MAERQDHAFRMAKPPRDVVKAAQNRFRETHAKAFENWAEYRRHKRVVEEEVNARVFGREPFSEAVRASLEELRKSAASRAPVIRDGQFSGPPVFHVGPGLNIIGPPYDIGLVVALGSNAPSVQTSVASGVFGVVATASSGRNTYGSAGLALFIVPSDPARTLSIRPYYQYDYTWSCESHGPPTAHSYGQVSADVSGHSGSSSHDFPGNSETLWSGSSDYWDDGSGAESDMFRIPDSELIVSGSEYYTVSYVCQASGDSNKNGFGWSVSYIRLHCRVPFIVVEEF